MTRTRKRIQAAAIAAGVGIESMEWEPIGPAMEMCGHSGGWMLQLDEDTVRRRWEQCGILGSYIVGYNASEVIEQIESIGRRFAGAVA